MPPSTLPAIDVRTAPAPYNGCAIVALWPGPDKCSTCGNDCPWGDPHPFSGRVTFCDYYRKE